MAEWDWAINGMKKKKTKEEREGPDRKRNEHTLVKVWTFCHTI